MINIHFCLPRIVNLKMAIQICIIAIVAQRSFHQGDSPVSKVEVVVNRDVIEQTKLEAYDRYETKSEKRKNRRREPKRKDVAKKTDNGGDSNGGD